MKMTACLETRPWPSGGEVDVLRVEICGNVEQVWPVDADEIERFGQQIMAVASNLRRKSMKEQKNPLRYFLVDVARFGNDATRVQAVTEGGTVYETVLIPAATYTNFVSLGAEVLNVAKKMAGVYCVAQLLSSKIPFHINTDGIGWGFAGHMQSLGVAVKELVNGKEKAVSTG